MMYSYIPEYALLRSLDTQRFYKSIKEELDLYIEKNKFYQDSSWYKEALKYRDYVLPQKAKSNSLRVLKTSLENFTSQLRGKANTVLSSAFSDETIRWFGSYLGMPGSDLKAKLEVVLGEIDPYKADYIYQELDSNFNFELYTSKGCNITPMHLLSDESKAVLQEIFSSDALLQEFRKQVIEREKTYRIRFPVTMLKECFDRAYPSGFEKDKTAKQKFRY